MASIATQQWYLIFDDSNMTGAGFEYISEI
jgi:hypothetical protein